MTISRYLITTIMMLMTSSSLAFTSPQRPLCFQQRTTQYFAEPEKTNNENNFFSGFLNGILNQSFFGTSNNNEKSNTSSHAIAPGDVNRILEIPAKSMKLGGLKLFLSLHFMGQQNTPTKGTWRVFTTDSNDSNENNAINVLFQDESTGFTVRFLEDKIAVDRWSSSSSTNTEKSLSLQYLIQENVILNGFLDELQAIMVEGDDIREEDRLLVVDSSSDAIEQARNAISFS